MTGRFLLDTNIVIAIFATDAAVKRGLEGADEVFVPSVVLGELYYGARKSTRMEENVLRIDQFALNNAALTCDTETARHYGTIKYGLKVKGRPLPENDIWIAAIAKQYDLTLVSRDSHFNDIEGFPFNVW